MERRAMDDFACLGRYRPHSRRRRALFVHQNPRAVWGFPLTISQRVLQELGEAFVSWDEQDNPDANPPGYRKHGDDHLRSTVTWKNQGFKLDTQYNRVHLSKGRNMKESRYAAGYTFSNIPTCESHGFSRVEDVKGSLRRLR
ncbi:Transposable element, IS605 OrfB family [Halalkaliarchaeum sp. AArc-CO]|nr:Transposable element, IS605 OrfB family [Halalkaliarchaeum sp. AArc-CO]